MDILNRDRNDARTVGIRCLRKPKALLEVNNGEHRAAQIDDALDKIRRKRNARDVREIANLLYVQNADAIFFIAKIERHILRVLRRISLIHILCHLLCPPLLLLYHRCNVKNQCDPAVTKHSCSAEELESGEEIAKCLDNDFLLSDYLPIGLDRDAVDARLKWVGSPALLDMAMVARSMGIGGDDGQDLDASISPRGMRILAKIPRLSLSAARTIVGTWGSLQAILGATVEELQAVDGVDAGQARTLRDGLSRLAEVSIVDRYA